MPGPAPKKPGQRQRRNRTTTAATLEALPAKYQPLPEIRWSAIKCAYEQVVDVDDDPVTLRCPMPKWHHSRKYFEELEAIAAETGLPQVDPHDFDPVAIPWRPTTLAWWEVIWKSPMATEEWIEADVPGLFALALLVDEFWTGADKGVHAEIRQASREFGLSPFSRRQLQWEIKRVEGPKAAPAPARRPAAAKAGGVLAVLEGGKSSAPRRRRTAAK